MRHYDWITFTKRVSIRASQAEISDAWTTRRGLESWFLSKAEFTGPDDSRRDENSLVEPGDSYTWKWHGYQDYVGEGKILMPRDDSFLSFTFSGGSIVQVSTKLEIGETVCELRQLMTQDAEAEKRYYYIECGNGWTFYLANLKSGLEGGVDLRNKNNDLQNVINA